MPVGGRARAWGLLVIPRAASRALWVDFLFNAQGEDVVSGRRNAHGHESSPPSCPPSGRRCGHAARQLEHAIGDMQDFEFTVQDGRLYMLQTRDGSAHRAQRPESRSTCSTRG